ncbi:M20/M25/M40 family metallo-hydrolase [Roseomonas sp. OT10]|uniref:M20/M25/M40 family metallo-hydrolase n=1 Tax=Roseomonas cutis TaxID=2897332 RepID=UPI001E388D6B|nr:M20/M25/M40 family metallo-hydrolase [Roseomonas sp. OT10]UFN47060.1 M20/M25/M40 family metallo-hydrolase [Roseomonas sp. OT10]
MLQTVLDDLLSRQDAIRARLDAFLRLPSVSADPAYAPGMAATRAFLLDWLRGAGFADARLLEGDGQPAVCATWHGAPGRPTLLVYGHYDVQPPDPLEAWRTPPFEPTEIDGRLYARGASDVKGSTTIAIETLAAFLRHGGCPVNVTLFLEGEEETGSPGLRSIVEAHRGLLRADAMLSADGGRASPTVATVNVGARGSSGFEMTLTTAAKDVHSGRYGGAIRNALHEMAVLVASLHGRDGRIAVPGFLDGAPEPSAAQQAEAAAFSPDEAAFFAEVGAVPFGEPGRTMRERITLRPCIDVNGLWGGYTGEGGKTVIPHQAHAKVSLRLVPGQDPEQARQAVVDHLRGLCPEGCHLDVRFARNGSPASSLPPGHPLFEAARAVWRELSGQDPVPVRLGATVPITAVFREMLGIDTLMFGFNRPDEDVHAPNEHFHLDSLPLGLRGWAMLLDRLGRMSPDAFAPFRTAG